MKPIQIGTILYKNDDTEEIYKTFQSFFEVDDQEWWLIKYTIVREPSEDLIKAITRYYAKVKKQNKAHDEFVDRIATEVLEKLNNDDKDYILFHPDSAEHHFGLGLWIRNKYIHGQELNFAFYHPDRLSSEITARIASMIIDNYDYENPFYRDLYESMSFNHLRRLYHAVKGEFPDDLMDQYADLPDDYDAARIVKEKLRAIILNPKRFESLCLKYGINQAQHDKYKLAIDTYNEKNWDIVPYDLIVLTSKNLDPDIRQRQLALLKEVLKQTPLMAFEIPSFVFNQKDAVLIAVDAMGKSLRRFPRFSADDDVIKAALASNGESIQYVSKELRDKPNYLKLAFSKPYSNALKMRCMVKYRDNEEIVRFALEANGCNIEYASDRLKDDLEMAKFAVTHQKDWCPESTICNLSKRLRDNLEIALLDIRDGHACVNSYSKRLRDNDEVAEALVSTDNGWKLYMMSKRIQKKYSREE